ncbi:type IV pilus twitching motility protein PilT [Alkaliphilus sp. AH-315-G20]|nr:type IV pilus twitching motility protein PilT [Alkaliphilus sp. AH-315-G20]
MSNVKILELLQCVVQENASDLHITVGIPPTMRVNGHLIKIGDRLLMPPDTEDLAMQILTKEQRMIVDDKGEIDASFSNPGIGRFRINIYKQRGSFSLAIRIVSLIIPTIEELGLPLILKDLSRKKRGLILVTGPTGSGKSTTLASMIDLMNTEEKQHIITLEDPIEYLHKHKMSIINQREVGSDTNNFTNGLRACLRQDPDVILVGEMRDLETISIAITAAETGHLVLSTLHTVGAAKTIDRIIDVFPPHQQQQIKIQLAAVLVGIVSQQLLPRIDEPGRVAAIEIMVATNAISNLVREGKTHQIQTAIQTGMKYGMKTMDNSLLALYREEKISRDSLLSHSIDLDYVKKNI